MIVSVLAMLVHSLGLGIGHFGRNSISRKNLTSCKVPSKAQATKIIQWKSITSIEYVGKI